MMTITLLLLLLQEKIKHTAKFKFIKYSLLEAMNAENPKGKASWKKKKNTKNFQNTAHYKQAALASLSVINKPATSKPFVPASNQNPNSTHRLG